MSMPWLSLLIAHVLTGTAAAGSLTEDLDRVFADPAFAGASLTVSVQRVDNGRVVYERAPDQVVVPASTVKWITAVAAVERLGFDHSFETRLIAEGPLRSGVIEGDLVIVGGGDPGFSSETLRAWARSLASELEVKSIRGSIRADTSLFADPLLGTGWAWDDLAARYAAPISALSLDRNATQVTVQAPTEEGGSPLFDGGALGACLTLEATAEERPAIRLSRALGRPVVVARGALRPGAGTASRTVTIPDPGACAVAVFEEALAEEGIELLDPEPSPTATDGGEGLTTPEPSPASSQDHWVARRHLSDPLSTHLLVMLKHSQNLYAELLVRAIDPVAQGKTFAGAREVIGKLLARAGVAPHTWRLEDGSGLSRYNLLSAEALTRLSRYVAKRDYQEQLLAMLPRAGVDGTLTWRMVGGPAAERVRAKTGSMSNIRNLTGYVTTADAQELAVTLLSEGFVQPQPTAIYLQDTALELLASVDLSEEEACRPRRRWWRR